MLYLGVSAYDKLQILTVICHFNVHEELNTNMFDSLEVPFIKNEISDEKRIFIYITLCTILVHIRF